MQSKNPSFKELYDELKRSGDLKMLFPHLTGSWKNDKKQFIEIQENPNLLEFDDLTEFDYE